MNLYPHAKRDRQVLYAINFGIEEGWRKRRGYELVGNQVLSRYPITGIYDYRYPETNGKDHVLVAGDNYTYDAGAPTEPKPEGNLYYGFPVDNDVNPFGWAWVSVNQLAGITIPTRDDSRYEFLNIYGKAYVGNGGAMPIATLDYRTGASDTAMSWFTPKVDPFNTGDAATVWMKTLPLAKSVSAYGGALVLSNLSPDQFKTQVGGGTPGTLGPEGSSSFGDASARTTIIATAATWEHPDMGFNVAHSFTFQTKDDQEIVGCREFNGQLVFFLSNSVWILRNFGTEQPSADLLAHNVGCVSPHTIQETPAGLCWLGWDGVYMINRSFALLTISDDMTSIFMEGFGTYDSPALGVDRQRLYLSTSYHYCARSEYHLIMPMTYFPDHGPLLDAVFHYPPSPPSIYSAPSNEKGWFLYGAGSFLDASTGALTTKERGRPMNCSTMYADFDGSEFPLWGDEWGCVWRESVHNYDAYWITRISSGDNNTTAFNVASIIPPNENFLVGATLVIVDDRKTSEYTDDPQTEIAGRIPAGTAVTVVTSAAGSASKIRVAVTPALPHAPQTGATIAVYWPIRCRIIDEKFTGVGGTMKRLIRLMPRVKARNTGSLAVRIQGDPTQIAPDEMIVENAPDNTASLAYNGDVFGTVREFRSAAQVDVEVWPHSSGDLGRKFMVTYEEFSVEDLALYGDTIFHQQIGDR